MRKVVRYTVEENREMLLQVLDNAQKTHQALTKWKMSHREDKESAVSVTEHLDEYYAERRNTPLFVYLNELDFEQVEIIEAVMYIGRDYPDPPITDEEMEQYYEHKADNPDYEMLPKPLLAYDPDAVLSEKVQEISMGKEASEKEIDIDHIMSKWAMLPKYFSRAFEVLGVH